MIRRHFYSSWLLVGRGRFRRELCMIQRGIIVTTCYQFFLSCVPCTVMVSSLHLRHPQPRSILVAAHARGSLNPLSHGNFKRKRRRSDAQKQVSVPTLSLVKRVDQHTVLTPRPFPQPLASRGVSGVVSLETVLGNLVSCGGTVCRLLRANRAARCL